MRRMDHFNEPSARDRTMRDVFQGFRALGRTVHGARPASGLAVLRDRRRGATDIWGDPPAQPWADAGVGGPLSADHRDLWRVARTEQRRLDLEICLRSPAGLVPQPRERMELRQALRQPVLAEGPRAGCPVHPSGGLEHLRRSSPASVQVRTVKTGQAVPRRGGMVRLRCQRSTTASRPAC